MSHTSGALELQSYYRLYFNLTITDFHTLLPQDMEDDDPPSGISDQGDSDGSESVEYGVRRSRFATTYSRRHSSALYPVQFMIMEVLLSVAEMTLSQCMMLVFIAVIIAMHYHCLVSLLRHWNNIDSVSGAFKDACARS